MLVAFAINVVRYFVLVPGRIIARQNGRLRQAQEG
jgi:hypothetical protein